MPDGSAAATDTPMSVPILPTGTVTFLFSDIEGSTRLADRLRSAYAALLADHHRLVRAAFRESGGREVDAAGDGLFYAFPSARSAVHAAIQAQRSLGGHDWPPDSEPRVRMGLHTGEAVSQAQSYVGLEVHRAARIASAGHGGQVLLSRTTAELVGSDLPADVRLVDRGEHRLKDLAHPERLFQALATDLQADFPPLRSLDTMPNNLPRQLTSFVGRERVLEALTAALGAASLVTLTGPGGVGKTRLAIHAAAEVLDKFEGGVWLAELGTITDETLVLPTIATALAVPERPGAPLLDTVSDHVRARTVLLVLDDCEHVVDATARIADSLLRVCAEMRILATSREPLGIGGEQLFPVPSLSLPDAAGRPSPQAVAETEAGRLFEVRARAVAPDFRIDDRTATGVLQICRRLDGIPLAIELAAARVRSMPVEQIATRLDDRFRLLSGGSRTALPRHQTLRAAIDWSHELLPDPERAVLRRLSVFAGGFSVEAAEAVATGAEVESYDVLDLLTRLVDKSLVLVDDSAAEGGYRLLETIREFARERLVASGEAAIASRRHRDWYLRLVEQAMPEFFRGGEPAAWLERFDREHDNLRAALRWSVDEPGGGQTALRLAAGLWRFWEIRGHLGEGRAWLSQALAMNDGGASETMANALTGISILASMQGDVPAAVGYLEEGLTVARRLGDQNAIAYALSNLANTTIQVGAFDRARELYEETLEINRRNDDWRGEAITTVHLADVVDRLGDYPGARSLYETAAGMFRARGDDWGTAFALGQFAQTAVANADRPAAKEAADTAVALYRNVGDGRGVARTLTFMADLAAGDGDLARAVDLHRESLRLREGLGDRPGIATGLERLAATTSGLDPQRAARLLGAADALRDEIGSTRSLPARAEHDQRLADLQDRLGQDDLLAQMAVGRTLSVQAAIAEAAAIQAA
jgi:predicted ATPase/class 3 adenylate cyclase